LRLTNLDNLNREFARPSDTDQTMSTTKQPLRAALIGLSSTSVTSWASTAHLPGLLTPTGRSKYTITALLNSSAESAQNSIKLNNFPASTKAYGSPEDLAADPDIDVVICNTRVDQHYSTILPSIKAGKDVYVEWPIASNLTDIRKVIEETKKSGSRVAVGLQRRWIPPVLKVREIVREGKLGKILSSQANAYGGTSRRDSLVEGLKYFTDRKIGGNAITIGVGHSLDLVLSVTGRLDPKTVHSRMQLQRPELKIRDPKTGDTIGTWKSEVADFLSLHGE
jgi:predicted dehydrogenase